MSFLNDLLGAYSPDAKPFITGSRAYGIPKEDSDIDLVILVDKSTASFLFSAKDKGSDSVRFGRLNLIIFHSEFLFNLWRKCTEELKEKAKHRRVLRGEAVEYFQKAGFSKDQYGSIGSESL